jgi:hypothetical protein
MLLGQLVSSVPLHVISHNLTPRPVEHVYFAELGVTSAQSSSLSQILLQ